MSEWQLAQLNVAYRVVAVDSPQFAEFVNNLARINARADQSPGFVWRLESSVGGALSTYLFGESAVVNMSVWDSIESLHDYVYRSTHVEVLAKRAQWFELPSKPHSVLWWLPAGSIPTLAQGKARLENLRANGPSAGAFTFKQPFMPPTETAACDSTVP